MNLQCSISPLSRAHGNTIAEYVLIGVLVLTASLFVLLNFGKGFSQRIFGLSNDSSLHAQQAAEIQARIRENAALSPVTTIPGLGGKHSNSLIQSMVVQATGSNGSTSNSGIYGNTGKAGSGKKSVTPPNILKSMVKKLANQAHQIAQMEGLLSGISKYSGGSTDKFTSTNVYFKGQMMNANQVAAMLTQGSALNALQRQKNAIMNSSANQRLKNTISRLTNDVMQAAINTSHQVASGSAHVDHHVFDYTHGRAGSICKAGGNHDSGRQCSEH